MSDISNIVAMPSSNTFAAHVAYWVLWKVVLGLRVFGWEVGEVTLPSWHFVSVP